MIVTTLILGLDRNLPGDDDAVVHTSRLLSPADAFQVDDQVIDRGVGCKNKTGAHVASSVELKAIITRFPGKNAGNRVCADNIQQILSLAVHQTRPTVCDLAKALEQRWTVKI